MLAFLTKRIGAGLSVLLVVPSLTFLLMFGNAANAARQILGETATPEQVAAKAAELGVNRPLYVQFFDYVGHLSVGDLGRSWFTAEPIGSLVTSRATVTLTVVIGSILVSTLLAFALGVAAALRRGVLDIALQVLAIVGFAVPGFWLALLLVSNLALQLRLFPATGFVAFTASPGQWLASITLPIVALMVGAVAGVAQQVRGSVIDVLEQDYVRTLRARGLPSWRVVAHVLRNASAPALTVVALTFIGTLSGAVFVERIFALPGLGLAATNAAVNGDVPVIMGVVLVMTTIVVLVNLVVDLAIGLLNPKVRLS
ncbi:ABC transporter permease [Nonomuraea sp. NPDC049141]|uniref:ABC transporter permease n=1 Tax=unclassified Nonomuraea TaxID=2593643 RepID=UPI0033CEB955